MQCTVKPIVYFGYIWSTCWVCCDFPGYNGSSWRPSSNCSERTSRRLGRFRRGSWRTSSDSTPPEARNTTTTPHPTPCEPSAIEIYELFLKTVPSDEYHALGNVYRKTCKAETEQYWMLIVVLMFIQPRPPVNSRLCEIKLSSGHSLIDSKL